MKVQKVRTDAFFFELKAKTTTYTNIFTKRSKSTHFQCMSKHIIFILAALVCIVKADGEENFKITLYTHQGVSESVTNSWRFEANKLENLPVWKPGDGEPPISLGEVIRRAKSWVISKGSSKKPRLVEVSIRAIDAAGGNRYGGIYFYNVRFGDVGYFGQYMRCIVLMDGTIVEPERNGTPINSSIYANYVE